MVTSTRPGRLGPSVARWFLDTTAAVRADHGVEVDLADLAEIGLPLLDEPEHPSTGRYVHEHTLAWSRQVAAADAVVILTPEYNHAMPATLKNALDYLSAEWAWKPVSWISYGNTSAGTRAMQMGKQVTTTLRMVSTGASVSLRIADEFASGRPVENPARDAAAVAMVEELIRLARVLRPLRRVTGEGDGQLEWHRATPEDAAELLVLQRCCWVEEALANDTLAIPALHESIDDVRRGLATWSTWCVREQGRLVGSVRARASGDSWEIGRLMVAPDLRGRGLGRALLDFAEQQAPDTCQVVQLTTGIRSVANHRLYAAAGYATTARDPDQHTAQLAKPGPTVEHAAAAC